MCSCSGLWLVVSIVRLGAFVISFVTVGFVLSTCLKLLRISSSLWCSSIWMSVFSGDLCDSGLILSVWMIVDVMCLVVLSLVRVMKRVLLCHSCLVVWLSLSVSCVLLMLLGFMIVISCCGRV